MRWYRRAQGAFEFIMAYGWALLLVAITGSSLWFYFGVDVPSIAGEHCIMGPGFYCKEFFIDTSGIVFIIDKAQDRDVDGIFIDGNPDCTIPSAQGSFLDSAARLTIAGCNFTEGEYYRGTMIFSYTLPVSSVTHSTAFSVRGRVRSGSLQDFDGNGTPNGTNNPGGGQFGNDGATKLLCAFNDQATPCVNEQPTDISGSSIVTPGSSGQGLFMENDVKYNRIIPRTDVEALQTWTLTGPRAPIVALIDIYESPTLVANADQVKYTSDTQHGIVRHSVPGPSASGGTFSFYARSVDISNNANLNISCAGQPTAHDVITTTDNWARYDVTFNSFSCPGDPINADITHIGKDNFSIWGGQYVQSASPEMYASYGGDRFDFDDDGIDFQQGTVEFWVSPRWSSGNLGGTGYLFDYKGSGSERLYINTDSVITTFFINDGSTPRSISYPISWQADEWWHLEFTWNNTHQEFFINSGSFGIANAPVLTLPPTHASGQIALGTEAGGVLGSEAEMTFDSFRVSDVIRYP